MRKFLIPAVLVLAVAAGSTSALAATKAAPMASPKAGECAKQWKAEKKHTQTKKAFLAACEKA